MTRTSSWISRFRGNPSASPQRCFWTTERLHVLGDFLIAAHALVHADCILSRDLGIYKAYFSDLKVVGSIGVSRAGFPAKAPAAITKTHAPGTRNQKLLRQAEGLKGEGE